MPYEFNPDADAAVLYGSTPDVEIDEAAFALQEEDFLLTHKCRRTADCQTERIIGRKVSNLSGNAEDHSHCVLRIDFDQTLEFQIEATALSLQGLANHHPGAGLDDYSLAFLNGSASDLPFRFTGGTWIYMNPSQDCAAGDLAEISFNVVREFADLIAGEAPPVNYAVIPDQDPVEALAAAQTKALQNAFHAAAHLTGAFTATLYNGDPLGAGTAVSEVLTLAAWNDFYPGHDAGEYQVRNQLEITWETSLIARSVTHILYKRGADTIAAPALGLTVQAGYGVRAPIGHLGISMKWPADSFAYAGSYLDYPSGRALILMTGGAAFPAGSLTIEAWEAIPDPNTPDTLLDSFTVARTGTEWDVDALTVENLVAMTGSNLAPFEDWTVSFVSVRITSLAGVRFIFLQLPAPVVFTAGSPVSFAPGEINCNLAA